jgi:hypothetical protein
MTTKSKLLLIFGGLFLSFFLLIIGSAFFMLFVSPIFYTKRAVELNQKRSAETFGNITSVSEYRTSGDKYRGSSVNTNYEYEYIVNGVTYKGEQSSGGKRGNEKRLKVKVCYNPSDPNSSAFYRLEDNKICGATKTEK